MRTIILSALAAASVAAPIAAEAQSYGEVRRSAQDVRESRRDLAEAQAYGSRRDIREARRDLRDDRRELRQDWRDYRQAHRDVYTRPGYAGPRGYRYRPIAPGYRFAPDYYGRRYWINDPYTYRLPRPGFGYQRWIRYGNDVVLVDTRNGRAVTVYDRFFY